MSVGKINAGFQAARLASSPGGKRMTAGELSSIVADAKKGGTTKAEKQALADRWHAQTVTSWGGGAPPPPWAQPKPAPGATTAATRAFEKLQAELRLPLPSRLLIP